VYAFALAALRHLCSASIEDSTLQIQSSLFSRTRNSQDLNDGYRVDSIVGWPLFHIIPLGYSAILALFSHLLSESITIVVLFTTRSEIYTLRSVD